MLGWGRKSDATPADRSSSDADMRAKFEQRREQIRRTVLGVGRTAGAGVAAARRAALTGLRVTGAVMRAGARAAHTAGATAARRLPNGPAAVAGIMAGVRGTGVAARRGARAGRRTAIRAMQRALSRSTTLAMAARESAQATKGSLRAVLARPVVPGVVAAAGTLALGAGIGRWRGAGLDGEAMALLGLGTALLASLAPMAVSRLAGILPGHALPLIATTVVGVAVLAAAALRPVYRDSIGTREVAGRAAVVAGDVLKVDGTAVRLAGLDTPGRAQLCGKDGGRWRCAEVAQSALAKVIAGRTVRCRLGGTDTDGRPLGLCTIDAVDINAELVRQGYAFADGGPSGRFGAQEGEARAAKAGMWIGDAVRPSEYRARAWQEAKHRAPDGCPIKGQVKGVERVYVLPGAPSYARLRVLTARGDRWFCSEQDATAAGFKAARGAEMPGA